MDWDDLRFFLAVARKGSVRAAAQALGVNHSTVSRRINGFEEKLGVRLFERLPTGYLTTPAGEEMMDAAQRMEEEAAAIDRRLLGRDKRLSGLLRVTVPAPLATGLLMTDLVAFAETHPGIDLDIVETNELANLKKREADVAIRLTNDPPEYLVGRRILKYATAIYASRDYLARHDPLGDPSAMSWIGWNDVVPNPQWVRESAFPKTPVRHHFNSPSLQMQAAKAGLGLSMLPCFIGDNEPSLRRLPPGKSVPGRDFWLLTHEDLRNTARVRKFLDFMAGAILRHRELLEGREERPGP